MRARQLLEVQPNRSRVGSLADMSTSLAKRWRTTQQCRRKFHSQGCCATIQQQCLTVVVEIVGLSPLGTVEQAWRSPESAACDRRMAVTGRLLHQLLTTGVSPGW